MYNYPKRKKNGLIFPTFQEWKDTFATLHGFKDEETEDNKTTSPHIFMQWNVYSDAIYARDSTIEFHFLKMDIFFSFKEFFLYINLGSIGSSSLY